MTETTRTGTGMDLPDLRRLRYFHGQMLGARDFRREQAYVREKLRLRMRHLLGYGVVCGLRVQPVRPGPYDQPGEAPNAAQTEPAAAAPGGGPAAEQSAAAERSAPAESAGGAEPAGGEAHRRRLAKIRITDGLGVDCVGNEVVVYPDSGCEVDLWAALSAEERAKWPGQATFWVGVEYAEQAVEPTRMVYDDACGGGKDCDFGYTQERFVVRVRATPPAPDPRCDTCPPCEDPVLWLARIEDVDRYRPVRDEQVHEEIRRPFGLRRPTVITGVSWRHGHTYSVEETQQLLGTYDESGGLVVQLSDGVHARSLRPGVVDIEVLKGGRGESATVYRMAGEFQDVPDEGFTDHFRYRQVTGESLQHQDRVLITVRTAFILDRCCRPVDGTNVGGLVPLIGGGPDPEFCPEPPSGIGPWTSGSGAGGATFESWFFVRDDRVRDQR